MAMYMIVIAQHKARKVMEGVLRPYQEISFIMGDSIMSKIPRASRIKHKTGIIPVSFKLVLIMVAVSSLIIMKGHVVYAEVFVYPNQGQNPEQLNRDKYECQDWARQQTGVDPLSLAQQAPQTQEPRRRGGLFRGAARGPVLGVIGGAIGGDAGKGAAIGAGVGATAGLMRKRQAEREQVYAYEEANQHRRSLMNIYEQAYRACLEGKGYTAR